MSISHNTNKYNSQLNQLIDRAIDLENDIGERCNKMADLHNEFLNLDTKALEEFSKRVWVSSASGKAVYRSFKNIDRYDKIVGTLNKNKWPDVLDGEVV